jgi:hypothetical protein
MVCCRVPLRQICCEHQFEAGLQLYEQIMPLPMAFLLKAQAPGGSFILAAKDAFGKLAMSATAPASVAIFKSEMPRIFVPIGLQETTILPRGCCGAR